METFKTKPRGFGVERMPLAGAKKKRTNGKTA
jgi:hypothetical protein